MDREFNRKYLEGAVKTVRSLAERDRQSAEIVAGRERKKKKPEETDAGFAQRITCAMMDAMLVS
jgi:hypothetical protein